MNFKRWAGTRNYSKYIIKGVIANLEHMTWWSPTTDKEDQVLSNVVCLLRRLLKNWEPETKKSKSRYERIFK